MLFRRKRKMIDVRRIRKGPVVSIPQETSSVPQTSDGFVDFASSNTPSSTASSDDSDSNPLSFLDASSDTSSNSVSNQFSSEVDGYSKREVDAKLTDLDNKLYRLEQRLELLERKAGVGSGSDGSDGSLIGW